MKPTDAHRATYIAALGRGDRRAAIRLAVELLDAGMSLGDVVLGVLAPAQAEVGLRWQDGRWTRLQEYAATNIAEAVLAVAAARQPPAEPRGNLVLCLAEREHHNLPARMVAELLRADGFRVTFLGAPGATAGVAQFLAKDEPDALIVSCSISMNLPGAIPLVLTAHGAGVPVIAGGRGFGTDDVRSSRLGADALALSIGAVGDALRGFADTPPPLATPEAELAQQAELAAIRGVLAEELSDRIEYQQRGLVTRGPRLSRRLRTDMKTLLRFLEAAVLCDERILAEYATWFASRATLQGYDERLAPLIFRCIEERLTLDLPATAAPLRAARQAAENAIGAGRGVTAAML